MIPLELTIIKRNLQGLISHTIGTPNLPLLLEEIHKVEKMVVEFIEKEEKRVE